VYTNDQIRGRLVDIVASLLFSLSNEILKWQFPVNATMEKLAVLAAGVRSTLQSTFLQFARR
jgi:hypothetical protein